MSVFILPNLMVNAFGGLESLQRTLEGGEIHYAFNYPDGSLEVSTKDPQCVRILVGDPTESITAPSAKISYRSLAPFGAVAHRITLPTKLERRRLREAFFVYPAASSPVDSHEHSTERIGISIWAEHFGSEVETAICDAIKTTVQSIPLLLPEWSQISPNSACGEYYLGCNRLHAVLNLSNLDQRVLNWLVINVLTKALESKKTWGQTNVDLSAGDILEEKLLTMVKHPLN